MHDVTYVHKVFGLLVCNKIHRLMGMKYGKDGKN